MIYTAQEFEDKQTLKNVANLKLKNILSCLKQNKALSVRLLKK
jgi:hypothetical protein